MANLKKLQDITNKAHEKMLPDALLWFEKNFDRDAEFEASCGSNFVSFPPEDTSDVDDLPFMKKIAEALRTKSCYEGFDITASKSSVRISW